MTNYEEARAELTNTQLNRFESAARKKTGTTLRITKKTFNTKNYLMNYF